MPPGREAELGEDVAEVELDRLLAHIKLASDLTVGEAPPDEDGDVALPVGEGEALPAAAGVGPDAAAVEIGRQPFQIGTGAAGGEQLMSDAELIGGLPALPDGHQEPVRRPGG